MNGGKMFYKQQNSKVEEPPKYFRPWEDHNKNNAKSNLVEPSPATYLNYWPQPVVSTVSWWNWYLPYCLLVAAHPITAIWSGGATAVSIPEVPQPLPVNTPTVEATSSTMESTAPQESSRKRKREEEDEDEVDRLKAKRDAHLMKRISKLSRKQVEELLPYRSNMARKFAPKERTPAEQLKRDKNTEACRMSRRRKKLMEILKEFSFFM